MSVPDPDRVYFRGSDPDPGQLQPFPTLENNADADPDVTLKHGFFFKKARFVFERVKIFLFYEGSTLL